MACPHPGEERIGVYDGSAARRDDRHLCMLCGEILYANRDAPPPDPTAPASVRTRAERAGGDLSST